MENKTGTYFKYAIGEILLVVIGILIALQINNWNEARKDTIKEVKLLRDIKNDINKNIANLEEGLNYLHLGKQSNLKIISYIVTKKDYNESMIKDFTNFDNFWDPDFTEAAFENLKNLGVNFVSNDSLRNRIVELFEIDMDILDVSDLNSHKNYMNSVAESVFSKYFYYNWRSLDNIYEKIPLNYDIMIADQQFYAICSRILLDQEVALIKSKAFIEKSKLLTFAIEEQINLLQ